MKKEIMTVDHEQWTAIEEVAAAHGLPISTYAGAAVARALVPESPILDGFPARDLNEPPNSERVFIRIRVEDEVQEALHSKAAELGLSKSMVMREIVLHAAEAERLGMVARVQELTGALRRRKVVRDFEGHPL